VDRQAAECLAICLRLYPAMARTAEIMEEEIIQRTPPKEPGMPTSPHTSDATGSKAVQLLTHPDLRILRARLGEIAKAYADLPEHWQPVCAALFWSPGRDRPLDQLAAEVHVSYPTLVRWRRGILVHFAMRISSGWERPSVWWAMSPLTE
jgi:hypothetical protein